MTQANKSELKIEAHHCYRCGHPFSEERRKTKHHSIPKSLKLDRNIIIPICEPCHKELNGIDPKLKPPKIQIKVWRGMIENFKQFIIKQESIIEKYEKEEETT